MAQSAKISLRIVDRSLFIARQDGNPSAVVVTSDKGETGKSIFVTTTEELITKVGEPIGLDSGWLSAYAYLERVGAIYVSRAIGANAKYAYGLVYNQEYADTKKLDTIGYEATSGLDTIENQNQLFEDENGIQKYSFAIFNISKGDTSVEVTIMPVIGYDEDEQVFKLTVYSGKKQVEEFVVSMIDTRDIAGNPLNAESVINNESSYIRVMINPNAGTKPVYSTTSKWKRHDDPVFKRDDTKEFTYDYSLSDGVNKKIILPNVDNLTVGTKIVFSDQIANALAVNLTEFSYSEIFTIEDINTAENSITLNKVYNYIPDGDEVQVYIEDPTYTDTDIPNLPSDATVENGKVIYPVKEFLGAIIGADRDNYQVNGKFGTLISSATIRTTAGSNGDPVTEDDLIQALEPFKNRITTPVSIIMDGGYTTYNFQRAIEKVVDKQKYAQGYINVDLNANRSSDPVNKNLQYRRELGIDQFRMSLFSGGSYDYNDYLKSVYVLPASTIATITQTMVTDKFGSWMPSAGLKRGTFTSAGLLFDFNEDSRDKLVEYRINPLLHDQDTGVFAVWGNETLQSKPSYLQQRSVVSLLLDIGARIASIMPYHLFDLNDVSTWDTVEGSIRSMLRDDYKSKGALYDFVVSVKDIITDTDIDNRTMPVKVGVKPVSSINYIPIDLTVFSKSVDINFK